MRGIEIHTNVVSLYVMAVAVGENETKGGDNLYK
jgi:hypothetical protein